MLGGLQVDGCHDVASLGRCSYAPQPVCVFVGRYAVVDAGYLFVDEGVQIAGLHVVCGGVEDFAYVGDVGGGGEYESSVGESLVAVECVVALVGWHEGDEFVVLVVVHERVVEKTVAVVVHEAALEYEGAVFGACYECVPDFCLVGAVSFYSQIPLHFLYALKSRI